MRAFYLAWTEEILARPSREVGATENLPQPVADLDGRSLHALHTGRCDSLAYWRTASGIEVDLILGDARIAVEVKSSENPTDDHLKGLRAWRQEHPDSRCILVSRTRHPRRTKDAIEILPWREFLKRLWADRLAPEAANAP